MVLRNSVISPQSTNAPPMLTFLFLSLEGGTVEIGEISRQLTSCPVSRASNSNCDSWNTQNEDAYRFEQAKFHIIQELLGKLHSTVASNHQSKAYKLLLEELNAERLKARHMMKRMFNRSFGATFHTDTGQESAFAYHIHQYADVYTSKAENFLHYPSDAWLHVPFDIKIMPHHLKVPSSCFKG